MYENMMIHELTEGQLEQVVGGWGSGLSVPNFLNFLPVALTPSSILTTTTNPNNTTISNSFTNTRNNNQTNVSPSQNSSTQTSSS
jgi:uncharacterized membrane protein YfcA